MKRLILASIMACLACLPASSGTLENPSGEIVFVTLTKIQDNLYLDKIKIVKGTLKPSKSTYASNDLLSFKVLTRSGKNLYEASIPDPSIITLEYADDAGRLHSKRIVRDSVTFSLRFPYDDAAHRVVIFKSVKALRGGKQASPRMQILASFELNPEGKPDEK